MTPGFGATVSRISDEQLYRVIDARSRPGAIEILRPPSGKPMERVWVSVDEVSGLEVANG